jgi:hypothetical protein
VSPSPITVIRPLGWLWPLWLWPLWLGLVLPGCPSSEGSNPKVLWLAPDGSELRVKLVDTEPPPF